MGCPLPGPFLLARLPDGREGFVVARIESDHGRLVEYLYVEVPSRWADGKTGRPINESVKVRYDDCVLRWC